MNNLISNSSCEKLPGVEIISELNFNNHLETIIKKSRQKVHVLARITPYMGISKRKLLMLFSRLNLATAHLYGQVSSRLMTNKVNRLHERCLRIIYNGKVSSLVDLLAKDGSVTIHTRSLQVLATEMFRVQKAMSTELKQGLFCVRQTHYNLRNAYNLFYSKYKFCLSWF